jgi:hypothetical protein
MERFSTQDQQLTKQEYAVSCPALGCGGPYHRIIFPQSVLLLTVVSFYLGWAVFNSLTMKIFDWGLICFAFDVICFLYAIFSSHENHCHHMWNAMVLCAIGALGTAFTYIYGWIVYHNVLPLHSNIYLLASAGISLLAGGIVTRNFLTAISRCPLHKRSAEEGAFREMSV